MKLRTSSGSRVNVEIIRRMPVGLFVNFCFSFSPFFTSPLTIHALPALYLVASQLVRVSECEFVKCAEIKIELQAASPRRTMSTSNVETSSLFFIFACGRRLHRVNAIIKYKIGALEWDDVFLCNHVRANEIKWLQIVLENDVVMKSEKGKNKKTLSQTMWIVQWQENENSFFSHGEYSRH